MDANLQNIASRIKSEKSYRIAFLGDSITSTEWVHPNFREIIEYVLKEELTRQLNGDWKTSEWYLRGINCGFDGATSDDIIKLLDNEVLDYKPDLVISVWGTNDMEMGFGNQKHRANVGQILAKLSSTVPATVFCSSPGGGNIEWSNRYREYVDVIRDLFTYQNIQFLDLQKEFQAVPHLERFYTFKRPDLSEPWVVDGIDQSHPNSLGNAYIAQILLKEIWGIEFNPVSYIAGIESGEMYPQY